MPQPDHPSPRPASRRLRVFAFDPSLAIEVDTAAIKELVLEVPWEIDPETGEDLLAPGPVGEYLEVIDVDPASQAFYAPIDLNDPFLLAQDGLTPSEGNPGFHQQMVYAVAMTTIGHFERALGRVALWARRRGKRPDDEEFVRRLRIYPHALREANAYYSGRKKALLFGYFPVSSNGGGGLAPGSMVFTCLSHDVIAHEVTHALLDGMHPRFSKSTNHDVLALHEAFADLVGIFQHFSHPEVLEHQIARTRGDLASQNLLGQLAQQFGRAVGRGGALRDALGHTDREGKWHPAKPDPSELGRTVAPHARGAILVAAVFEAFLMIYKARIADLLRIATMGTGVLPQGDIHPDLVRRLADEAAKSAGHVLQMCIRALDYCPPIDVTFGDYLRAIVTADADLNPQDDHCYRVAMIDAFRRRGIYPEGVRSLSEDTLLWPTGVEALLEEGPVEAAVDAQNDAAADASADAPRAADAHPAAAALRRGICSPQARRPAARFHDTSQSLRKHLQQDLRSLIEPTYDVPESPPGARKEAAARRASPRRRDPAFEPPAAPEPEEAELHLDWNLDTGRRQAWEKMKKNAVVFHAWLTGGSGKKYAAAFGLTLDPAAPPTVFRGSDGKSPAVEIHSVRPALRRGAKGSLVTELVVEATQRRRGYYDPKRQDAIDRGDELLAEDDSGDFRFYRGATILIDPRTMEVRRVIRTAGTVADDDELERQRAFLTREDPPPDDAFRAEPYRGMNDGEDFARLHRFLR